MAAELDTFLSDAEVLTQAKSRYTETESYQAVLVSKYQTFQYWYAPPGFDQWPADGKKRPGKIHITTNILKMAVDVEARLQAKLPRVTLVSDDLGDRERARSQLTEKMMLAYLEATDWEVWMQTLCRAKAIYGKGVLKVFWNKEDRRPDVRVVENPANLRIGWGASDFSEMDWALYEYKLSPLQAMRRWPNIQILPPTGRSRDLVILPARTATHADPLAQRTATEAQSNYQPSDYENHQVLIWDYWYRKGDDICNAIIVGRSQFAKEPTVHEEMVDIPYVVIENDHEPGSPEGLSSIAPIIDTQIEMNRVQSNWAQLIHDELGRAYQINKDSIPGGMVPRAGEILPAGDEGKIEPIGSTPSTFPAEALNNAFWFNFHRLTGLPEIAFGNPGGADVSGRALAVQVEGAANRIDPRRTLLYGGLREVLIFWTTMLERLNPSFDVGDGTKVGMREIVGGFRRWRLVAPEITPRDVIEHSRNELEKMNAHAQSLRTTLDALGIDSPEDELKLIAQELSDMTLNPGWVQQQAAVLATVQQLQLNEALAAQQQQAQGATPGAALQTAQDQTGSNNVAAQQQQAQPSPFEDQAGLPTPPGGTPPLQQTTLVRSNAAGQGQSLQQIAINRTLGG
jgi:hypothetical protein